MPPKRVLLLVIALLAACSGDDDAAAPAATTVPPSGCPVTVAAVEAAVEHPVTVDPEVSDERTCAFVDDAGSRIEVAAESLGEQGFGAVLQEVERRAGPTAALPDGLVDGAERGWIAVVGRAVQVGAADDETLVVVAVTDPLLDADAAQTVEASLAGEVLPG